MGVNLSNYTILFTFPVMWRGWECDDEAHIAKDSKGNTVLLFGSHGGFYENHVSILRDKLEEYEEAISKTKQAIEMLNGDSKAATENNLAKA